MREKWIFTHRQKTETASRIPLLQPAQSILQKYANHPATIQRKKLLPVPTNQKLNTYLKEIVTACKIRKELTFHMARHTFATTVTLTNGVAGSYFEYGSASGETFNKKGKTDIQLRYDSSVVFVAECKFWAGEKGFHETIDQLLGYLTWRDSKTSIVLFVPNKEIVPVFQKVEKGTTEHACYINTKGKKADNWTEHVFHLPSDPNKELLLSILIFHLP